jgi:hypothetical protein
VGRKVIGRERRKVIGGIYFVVTITKYTLEVIVLDGIYVTWHVMYVTI